MASSLWPHRFGEDGSDVAGGVGAEAFDGRRALALGELQDQAITMATDRFFSKYGRLSAPSNHRKMVLQKIQIQFHLLCFLKHL